METLTSRAPGYKKSLGKGSGTLGQLFKLVLQTSVSDVTDLHDPKLSSISGRTPLPAPNTRMWDVDPASVLTQRIHRSVCTRSFDNETEREWDRSKPRMMSLERVPSVTPHAPRIVLRNLIST